MENSKIAWCDKAGIDLEATGKALGGYKNAARRTGLTLAEWIERRVLGLRWCWRCRLWKGIAAFTVDRSRLGGLSNSCRPCTSLATAVSRYGVSTSSISAMLQQQAGRCAICEEEMARPCIDHDHITGKVRALLCPRCNSGLGYIETAGFVAAAIRYLEAHRG